jgi:hypothetical protein
MGPNNVTTLGCHVVYTRLFGKVQPHFDPCYFLYASDGRDGIFLNLVLL